MSVACQGGDPGSAPPPSGPPVRQAQRPVLSLRGLFFFLFVSFFGVTASPGRESQLLHDTGHSASGASLRRLCLVGPREAAAPVPGLPSGHRGPLGVWSADTGVRLPRPPGGQRRGGAAASSQGGALRVVVRVQQEVAGQVSACGVWVHFRKDAAERLCPLRTSVWAETEIRAINAGPEATRGPAGGELGVSVSHAHTSPARGADRPQKSSQV